MIRFEVNVKPKGKERARHGKYSTYSTKGMVAYENEIKLMARQAMIKAKLQKTTTPLIVYINAFFKVTDGWPLWKKDLAHEGFLDHTSVPDGDNISKAVLDAMNGIVYKDDSQIVLLRVTKSFSFKDCIIISVKERNHAPSSIKTKKEYEEWKLKHISN